MRSETPFPIIGEEKIELCSFLYNAWTSGWLDEYSDEHFLIKAIENRLTTFVGKEQLIENNISYQAITKDGTYIDSTGAIFDFNFSFCINFSKHMQFLANKFGMENIKSFLTNQMSAGKKKYKEDAFFEALSEVSILSFYASRFDWTQTIYEPPVVAGINSKNPEARFIGDIYCRINEKDKTDSKRTVTINIEVKSPEFPHDNHANEKIVIPTILLTDYGRKTVKRFCEENSVTYMDPRVLKLRDFINSAASKFGFPKDGEFNLLYINWSYRDFPSNSFLEPWSLLTNEINGILTHPEMGKSIGIVEEAYSKISAIVVYTESLEGLMFSDFSYVWQRSGAGPKFRMWVLDRKLRKMEWEDESNVLFYITGMNPSEQLTQRLMLDYKSKTLEEMTEGARFSIELAKLINKNVQK